ncbi:MAG: PD-(D/E)XK nuclease family protein, partial [Clostridiales bacterium]|nr:PD-(D/E)XK nuclease family protein [Clostridiales bacterium]
TFNGTIDRIDVNNEQKRFNILDYKTGNKTIDFDDLYAGSSVQLPSYMHVYSSMHPDLSPDGVSYIHVKRVKRSATGIAESFDPAVVSKDHQKAVEETYLKNCGLSADPEDMRRMGEFAISRVKEKCEELYAGHFDARPAKIKKKPLLKCADCEYNQICNGNPESPDYNYLPTMAPKLNEEGKAMKKPELFFTTIKGEEE